MRSEWIHLSASALVTGVMSLILGILLDPTTSSQDPAQTLRAVETSSGQWMGMAVLFLVAAVALTLGLPAILSLFDQRGRVLALLGVAAFSVGCLGTAGYSMVMVFFRALVTHDAIRADRLDATVQDAGLTFFLSVWVAGFYLGIVVIALALFRAARTPVWVPVALLAFVAMYPLGGMLGKPGSAIQLLTLAVAFTGLAVAATSQRSRALRGQPVY